MSDTGTPARRTARVASELAACLPALHRALDRRIGREFPHPKPPEGQLLLLRLVAQQEGCTVREAAEALLMKPNNVSALVSQMTERHLLERRPDPDDKRVAHLHLTETSRRRLAEVRELEEAHLGEALAALTDRERDALDAATGALASLARHLHSAPAGPR
ncbi:MarR family winged helix-turn-helix transcriptional regulator [Streptomyces glaucescens]|uniref:MarR-family transcriptional regulator n=1 Tax=Streptomyces glaucescens TaxID=1907 RepID=A0A089X0H8_STRGA|nr:MarR family transcriptional regulator [Streptomyces glaucescens]AIR96513.1 marR-family transcriptional regulator [Streptomyces glaucescens]